MAEGKVLGIVAALITAGGGITAAIIGLHHSSNSGTTSPTTTPAAVVTGRVAVGDPSSPGAWVYFAPVENSSVDHLGPISSGTRVEIACSEQGPMAGDTPSTLWYKIRYRDGYGYIPSSEVIDLSNQSVAAC
jgi:hypothetical protein